MKLTVSEYATHFKTSVQSVYQRIKRGTLKSFKENGITYVIVEDEAIKDDLNPSLESDLKEALKLIKAQSKEIKRLSKALEKCNEKKESVYLQYIGELKQLQLEAPAPVKNDDVIDLDEVKPKKKKKKKKK